MHLADLHDASVADVVALPLSVLATLQEECAALEARTKRIKSVLDAALEQRYGGSNGPGTRHVTEGAFQIDVVTPKKVDWDADALNDMAAIDELLEWIDFVPKIAESRYKAAPERIRAKLDEARTEGVGKSKITIVRKEV